jgi:hypothetical protein
MVKEKFSINFFLLNATADKVGKAATAKEIPNIPIGKDCKLLAKLNIAKDPLAKVEAITVITRRLT